MKVSPVALGNLQVENNVFLAPMAGYTDYPFRKIALKQGYGLCFTELVSAKGLMYGGKNNDDLVFCGQDCDKTAIQIFGSDAYSMRWTCESDYLKNCKIVDINMGCPVPKVFKNGDGSALLTDIKKAEYIIKECVKSNKIITVKIRTGQVHGDDVATDFCMMAEQCGAKLVTIHGRVREDYYSGEPDYNAIYKAKLSVKIPIIANGGIFTMEDANAMMDKTGADGVMLARGGIANPFLVSELTNQKPTCNLKDFIKEHIENVKSFYPERRGVLEFRKFVSYYLRGIRDVKQNKLDLYKCHDFDSVLSIIDQIL